MPHDPGGRHGRRPRRRSTAFKAKTANLPRTTEAERWVIQRNVYDHDPIQLNRIMI
jgi:hypothetical protein